ncbi:hypothetical protein CEXT_242891 [Caerostris extrusa]|uniref:Uncharacterized protein n=1 Tax=Caerostris extrusa TaxID=172846 RepID=A0AAV4P207_CAEEX|nr:hypothetical protein CEXT_242891 [Caerostris extrusa]
MQYSIGRKRSPSLPFGHHSKILSPISPADYHKDERAERQESNSKNETFSPDKLINASLLSYLIHFIQKGAGDLPTRSWLDDRPCISNMGLPLKKYFVHPSEIPIHVCKLLKQHIGPNNVIATLCQSSVKSSDLDTLAHKLKCANPK